MQGLPLRSSQLSADWALGRERNFLLQDSSISAIIPLESGRPLAGGDFDMNGDFPPSDRPLGISRNAGINEANTKVRSYFASGTSLMYAVGAILGLIGAVKVYQKWNAGDQDTGKVAAAWFGSCVFLVVVATVIKAFFGV